MKVALSYPYKQYYEYMQNCGFDVHDAHVEKCSEQESIEKLKGFDAVAAMGELYSAPVLDALKDNLKIICRHGIGYDLVDVEHATKCGICVCNTPGSNAAGVAETALGLMLECLRGFYHGNRHLQKGEWVQGEVKNQICDCTVGLVGFGNIGQYLARYLSGFGTKVIAYDVRYNEEKVKELGVEKVSLEELLSRSDIVSLHLPHMKATDKIVNKEFLSKMKPTAFLVNTARGGLVDEKDLIEALKNNVIAGAGLDVFSKEPLPADSELPKLDNVFCTPHIAGMTIRSQKNGFDGIMKCIREYEEGKVPEYCLNPSYVDYLK